MRKLGLSRLLQLVVLVPLVAMVAFGGVLVLETLNAYRVIQRLSALDQLVVAASRLTIKALNGELIATQAFVASGSESQRADMMAARKFPTTSSGHSTLRPYWSFSPIPRWSRSSPISNVALAALMPIARRLTRARSSAVPGRPAATLNGRPCGFLPAPCGPGQGGAAQRAADGAACHHADERWTKDRSRPDRRSRCGQGPLDAPTYQILLNGLAKESIFGKQFNDFGPALARDRLAAFDAGPDGRAIAALRPSLLAMANGGGKVAEAETERWRDAMVARNVVWSAAVETTVEALTATTVGAAGGRPVAPRPVRRHLPARRHRGHGHEPRGAAGGARPAERVDAGHAAARRRPAHGRRAGPRPLRRDRRHGQDGGDIQAERARDAKDGGRARGAEGARRRPRNRRPCISSPIPSRPRCWAWCARWRARPRSFSRTPT